MSLLYASKSPLSLFLSSQGYPGEKGVPGSTEVIDFNGKLLEAFQVSPPSQRCRQYTWCVFEGP